MLACSPVTIWSGVSARSVRWCGSDGSDAAAALPWVGAMRCNASTRRDGAVSRACWATVVSTPAASATTMLRDGTCTLFTSTVSTGSGTAVIPVNTPASSTDCCHAARWKGIGPPTSRRAGNHGDRPRLTLGVGVSWQGPGGGHRRCHHRGYLGHNALNLRRTPRDPLHVGRGPQGRGGLNRLVGVDLVEPAEEAIAGHGRLDASLPGPVAGLGGLQEVATRCPHPLGVAARGRAVPVRQALGEGGGIGEGRPNLDGVTFRLADQVGVLVVGGVLGHLPRDSLGHLGQARGDDAYGGRHGKPPGFKPCKTRRSRVYKAPARACQAPPLALKILST